MGVYRVCIKIIWRYIWCVYMGYTGCIGTLRGIQGFANILQIILTNGPCS